MNKIESIYNTVIHSFEQLPDLDIKEFATLKVNTNEEVALKILARFRVTLSECVQGMSDGLEKNELERIWQAAHKIAGSAQLLGFKYLGIESRELYQELKKSHRLESEAREEVREFIQYGRLILKEIETNFPQHAEFL